jgi:hypothetical protein
MGIAYKRRSFLIQGVSDEIQFLAGNIEHFLDDGSDLSDRIWRVKLEGWLYTLPDPVLCAATTSAS